MAFFGEREAQIQAIREKALTGRDSARKDLGATCWRVCFHAQGQTQDRKTERGRPSAKSPSLTRGHKAGFFMALQEVCRSPQHPSDKFP